MSSEVETPLTSINNLKDIYSDSICFIAPLLSLHDTDNICHHYRNNEELNNYNNNNIDNHDVFNNVGLISDTNIQFHSNQFMKIPINMMPPPTSKVVSYNNNNNNNVKRYDHRNNGKNRCADVRSLSPKGYESDESCTSFSSRTAPPNSNGNKYRNARNGMGGRLGDQTVMFGKFSHSSPNMFLYHHNNGGGSGNFHKNRYYSNGNRHRHHQFNKNNSDVMVRRAHGLMERFKSRAHLMRIDPNPPGLLNSNQWDSLNQAIWDVFSSKAQKEESYIKKLNVWRTVFLFIRKFLDSYGLFLVGSTMSSFGLETSDIDICLLTKPFITDPRSDSVHHLEQLKYYLLKCGVTEEAEVIHAKVPILKFKDSETGFEVDLNCNNSVGIRNTHLLNCYARLDWRVRPLVIIVKLWAQANNINDAKNMTISSYSWALMVIHYLQCGTTPPVLPCLHAVAPEKFNSDLESQSMDVQEELEILREYKSFNTSTLGELLVGFLQYYSYFDFSLYAISVRSGSRLPIDECRTLKAPKNDPHQWKCLCIEEPFDYSNTARSVYDPDTFKRICEVLNSSYNELAVNKTLNSILPVTVTPR